MEWRHTKGSIKLTSLGFVGMTAQSLVVAFCLESYPVTCWVLKPMESLGVPQSWAAATALGCKG